MILQRVYYCYRALHEAG